MTALALVKAYIQRNKIFVFKSGHHGGLSSFGKDSKVIANTMKASHHWIDLPYTDIEILTAAIAEHKDDLAYISLNSCKAHQVAFQQICNSFEHFDPKPYKWAQFRCLIML